MPFSFRKAPDHSAHAAGPKREIRPAIISTIKYGESQR
jgi:hypothetical protein